MKLNLTQSQLSKASKGQPFQLKHEQIGSGMNFNNLHPTNMKKINNAHKLGKGVRLSLTGGELGGEMTMNGGKLNFKKIGKQISRTINKGAKAYITEDNINKLGKTINKGAKKYITEDNINKLGNTINKGAKKYITEDNLKKYSLKGYNMANKALEKQGLSSIHKAVLNEGFGNIPFIPQAAKDVASHYANNAIDKRLKRETEKVGAGLKRNGVNPYIPTGLLNGGRIASSQGVKVYDDMSNVIRPRQSGFVGRSAQQSEMVTAKKFRGGSFSVLGGR